MADLLMARAQVRLPDPLATIQALEAHFAGHATVRTTGEGAVVEAPQFGRLTLRAHGETFIVACESPNALALGFLKMVTAEGFVRHAPSGCGPLVWTGDGTDGGLPFFRAMEVVASYPVTRRMRRVILRGDAGHFTGPGLHVRVLIPPRGRRPVWPHAGVDGRIVFPEGADALVPRVYTVRAVDTVAGTIAIDAVLHEGDCPGATWAREAAPGDAVGLLGPGGARPEPGSWNLFAGDETALPAIARLLEALPAQSVAVVRIEVADAAEQQVLATPARLDLRYLPRDGRPAGRAGLLPAAIRDLAFPVDLATARAFVGCEQAEAREIRSFLTKEAGFDKAHRMVAAYWRLGHAGVDIGD
ncbi:siderophore-interacting protein [Aquabacter sp. L1I39]|uniref:siderophore-interacting protein n=1 Tax=Aquabacter sp. L1I39 TaxID=2820278 RepID=UPI001ADB8BB3|nr:siderophore-interacting protein [Aquabacter sp. L1I39]QTL04754.1 siderophore-interacting protein [Aquabacter sp. L1I39]